jgi:hypothetical protein
MDRYHENTYSSCANLVGRLGHLAFRFPHIVCMVRDGWRGAGPMDRFHAGIYSCYTSRLDLGRLGWSGFRFHEEIMIARRRGAGPMDRFYANMSYDRVVLNSVGLVSRGFVFMKR